MLCTLLLCCQLYKSESILTPHQLLLCMQECSECFEERPEKADKEHQNNLRPKQPQTGQGQQQNIAYLVDV